VNQNEFKLMTDLTEQPAPQPAFAAYLLPFAAFMVLTACEGLDVFRDYYSYFYTTKIAVVFGLCFVFRKQYPRFSSVGTLWGVLYGIVGFGLWIGLCHLNLERHIVGWLPSWLYSADRVAYDPFSSIDTVAGQWSFWSIRMLGLSVVVPVMEEIFWRGFLIRFLISEDFEKVPFEKFTAFSFWGVTLLFTAAHPELLAALAWCAGMNVLLYKTKNLSACVVAHGVTNFMLGIYILQSGHWELW